MKIIIEGYQYPEAVVAQILKGFEPYTKNGKASIDLVGYFFSKEISDCIFFLPKVLINENKNVLFHDNVVPEDIVDLDKALKEHKIDDKDFRFLYNFAVWIYRAIKEYYRLNFDSKILLHRTFSLIDGSTRETDVTLLDIILSLVRFNNENQDFFMFTIKNTHSGYNKINWNKTLSHSQAIARHGTPIYLNPINKKKQINFDEELLVIFFSILDYCNRHFGFSTPINVNYELLTDTEMQNYIDGLGTIRLLQIKHKYFSDKAVMLWKMCYSFFDASERIASSSQDSDYMLAKNFNIVFEAIIDELIGDSKHDLPDDLKDQPDGKIVDHIFRYASLTNDNEIYYIGDSKYYQIGGSLSDNSVYKQYTYAKNVIQFNINWFFQDRPHIRYRDNLTEGYNITPNFFISSEVSKDLSYIDANLILRESERNKRVNFQFKNRLFDRDTLWLSHYDINFLYIIALYARANEFEKKDFKRRANAKFKEHIITLLNEQYHFFILQPKETMSLQRAVDINFKRLYGKVFRPYDDRDCLILSFEKKAELQSELESLLHDIRPYFYIHRDYILGGDIDSIIKGYVAKRRSFYDFVDNENFFERLAAESIAAEAKVEYGNIHTETIARVFNDSEKNRNAFLAERQIEASDLELPLPLEHEKVLVGYLNGDTHLAAIKKNLLYYTRMETRPGSLRIEINPETCKYLFLHNKDNYLLFKLSGFAPRVFTGEKLARMGFHVRKPQEHYLGFDLESTEQISLENIDLRNAIVRGIGNRTADSYFTTLKQLFNM